MGYPVAGRGREPVLLLLVLAAEQKTEAEKDEVVDIEAEKERLDGGYTKTLLLCVFVVWHTPVRKPEGGDSPGTPPLNKLTAIEIVREVLPRRSLEENVVQYTGMVNRIHRCMTIHSRTAWGIGMQAILYKEGSGGELCPVTGLTGYTKIITLSFYQFMI